jgi:magnesium transporter
MTRSRVYRDGRLESENFPPDQLAANLADPDTIVWLDLAAPGEDDLAEISRQLGLHELAVEDAVQQHQRPKLDHYPGHALLVAYAAEVTKDGGFVAHELAIFVARQTLITVRKDTTFNMENVVTRWDADINAATGTGTNTDGISVSYLLHGVLDYIVDTHLDAVQALDEIIEGLEDDVFTEPPTSPGMQRRSLTMHKNLGGLRRKVTPMRDVLVPLMRADNPIYREPMLPYYQDVLDHVLWASEQIESLRDLIATIRDTQLNLQGNRMNLIMKKVTSWAAIIAVPTAITGFYGQNLPVPGVDQPLGLWISTVAIALTSVGLYASFKHRDWL